MPTLTIDVPNVPGVPPLPSYAPGGLDLMQRDTVDSYGANLTPVWGLYKGGTPIIDADSVIGFGFRREWNIANYPIENGGFESYNRVDLPYTARIGFAAGGNVANRRALLQSLDLATADGNLTKYDVVTPEKIYTSVNIQHIDYDRKATSGLGLLQVEIYVQEIREQASPQNGGAGDSKSPSGDAPQSGGTVQPTDVPFFAPNDL